MQHVHLLPCTYAYGGLANALYTYVAWCIIHHNVHNLDSFELIFMRQSAVAVPEYDAICAIARCSEA